MSTFKFYDEEKQIAVEDKQKDFRSMTLDVE